MNIDSFEDQFREKVKATISSEDPAHDLAHFERVVKNAKTICSSEEAQLEVVLPAAWLHDLVIIPKDDPRRSGASKLSAFAAVQFLNSIGYPSQYFDQIAHAIAAHSFSAQIKAETLEAQIVQDADRLDGIGAIGIARCFAVAGILNRPLYNVEDPFCKTRQPDDSRYTIDHFYKKLLTVADSLNTATAREIGRTRAIYMKSFLLQLENELL